jgi:hypothetical protein
MTEFNVVTVPSFGDFVAETTDVPDSTPPARIVLGEKTRQRSGVPIMDLTLDLQAFNDHGELVWLSKSMTIVGFLRNGTFDFDNPKKQAQYEAMHDLKRIVEDILNALGFDVRPGRYILPGDYQPLKGVFGCVEWSWDKQGHLQVVAAPDW